VKEALSNLFDLTRSAMEKSSAPATATKVSREMVILGPVLSRKIPT